MESKDVSKSKGFCFYLKKDVEKKLTEISKKIGISKSKTLELIIKNVDNEEVKEFFIKELKEV